MRVQRRAVAATLPRDFRSTFLDGLTPRDRRAILKAARPITISPHEILQQERDPAARLWLLVTGRVAVYRLTHDGNQLFLGWGVPGETFGLATIVGAPARYLVTVEAVQEGSGIAWDPGSCRSLVSRHPSVSKALGSVAANYLARVIDLLTMSTFQTAEQRVARVLVEGARQLGRSGGEGIELDLTNEQVAVAAHVSLFTASRNLSRWQHLGVLRRRRGRIVLSSVSLFERIIFQEPA